MRAFCYTEQNQTNNQSMERVMRTSQHDGRRCVCRVIRKRKPNQQLANGSSNVCVVLRNRESLFEYQ